MSATEPKQGVASANDKSKAGKKAVSAVARRKRVDLLHRGLRFAIQAMFFFLAPALFSGAFSAVKYACAQIGAGAPIEFTAFALLLVAVLAFTVVFGRFFCGYACAFGTLGDVLYAIPEFIRSKTAIPRVEFPTPLVRVLSLVKYAVLAAICLACFFGAWTAYSGYSPWVAFAALLAGTTEGIDAVAWLLLGLIAAGMILRERFFCQFLCPLGAIFSLMPVMGFSEYTRNRDHCARKCGACRTACPVDIWPDADALAHGECISCGRCADACPMANVNFVALERQVARRERLEKHGDGPRPLRKTRESWYLLRGSGVAYTLLKAALLLAVCWVVGATRYLPAFVDVFGPLPLFM